MRARLIAMAVAHAFAPVRITLAGLPQRDLTIWPHGYQRNPFMARAPLTLAQHGKRLVVERAINGEQVAMIRGA